MRTKTDEKGQKILQAAIKIFAQKGYEKAKISEIADLAGVAHGSVYTYYKNKEDLLFKMISTLWQSLSEQLLQISKDNSKDPLQKLHQMVEMAFDVFTGNPQLGQIVVKEHNKLRQKGLDASKEQYAYLVRSFCRVYDQGVQGGFFNPTINCELYLHFVFGGIYHIVHRWAYDPLSVDIEEARVQVKHYVQQSLLGG